MKKIYALFALFAVVSLACESTLAAANAAAPMPAPAAVNTAPARRLEVKPQHDSMFVRTIDNLQIRAEPSTTADVIDTLPYRARIEVEVEVVVTVDDPICTRWRKLTARAGWVCAEWTDGGWQ